RGLLGTRGGPPLTVLFADRDLGRSLVRVQSPFRHGAVPQGRGMVAPGLGPRRAPTVSDGDRGLPRRRSGTRPLDGGVGRSRSGLGSCLHGVAHADDSLGRDHAGAVAPPSGRAAGQVRVVGAPCPVGAPRNSRDTDSLSRSRTLPSSSALDGSSLSLTN